MSNDWKGFILCMVILAFITGAFLAGAKLNRPMKLQEMIIDQNVQTQIKYLKLQREYRKLELKCLNGEF
jgi:hypothetical protein